MIPSRFSLGKLSHVAACTEPIDASGEDPRRLIQQLRMMLVIRAAEERIGDSVATGQVACPCHLGIGQEAIAVGVSSHLRKTDRVFGGHRSHSHYLAQGGDLYKMFAEIQGKESGCSKGMGGSMHLYDAPNGFIGSVPIVAGTVPLAVGAALAAQKEGKQNVGVAYFGDGAAEEGVTHESMNFAAVFKLPMLFVCENNLFSSHLRIDLRQPSNSVARFAKAHCIPYEVVDGNDVVAVARATARLLENARHGKGPGFLEAVTYRWRGHVGHREDQDVGVDRDVDLVRWKQRDPVRRLAETLESQGTFSDGDLYRLTEEVRFQIEHEWKRAEKAPFPPPSATLNLVYA
jgi:pyruvate dehydrogenase E1 component alpha subunit